MREYVKDIRGRTLGTYEDNGVGGRIEARDAGGRRLGYYDKRQDETHDSAGRLLGKGNRLPAVLLCR